jgi:hypothetical protein
MTNKQSALVLIVGKYSFEVNPLTDPEVQRIRREVEESGGWKEFIKAVNSKVKN